MSTLALRFHVLNGGGGLAAAGPKHQRSKSSLARGRNRSRKRDSTQDLELSGCTWSTGREVVVLRGVSRLLGARHDGGVSERARVARCRRSPRIHLSHNVTQPTRRTMPHRVKRRLSLNKLAVGSERLFLFNCTQRIEI